MQDPIRRTPRTERPNSEQRLPSLSPVALPSPSWSYVVVIMVVFGALFVIIWMAEVFLVQLQH
jgi:hypothetical protein